MHGEYKVPGGKLVVVELETGGGVITSAAVSGDFFLEPDDALGDINAAIKGLPISATAEDITRALEVGVDAEVSFIGFSREAVAIAVRRALANATDWRDYEWELIWGDPLPPELNLALDQVLTEEVGAGRRKPTLRIWQFSEPAVIIGSFQSVKNEVDPEGAAKHGVKVVRRITGGGAMYMNPADAAVTYSLYVPAELVAGMSFAESYAYLDDWVLQTLRSIGVDASYKPLNDITSPEGKIGGAAQKRLGAGSVLHHAMMAYDMNGDAMVEVLRIGREKMSDKGTKSANKRVSPLRAQSKLPREAIMRALGDTFTALYGAQVGKVTPQELERAQQLAREKFTSDAWTNRVP